MLDVCKITGKSSRTFRIAVQARIAEGLLRCDGNLLIATARGRLVLNAVIAAIAD